LTPPLSLTSFLLLLSSFSTSSQTLPQPQKKREKNFNNFKMFRVALLPLALLALAGPASAGVLTDWTHGIATHYGGAQEGMNPVSCFFSRVFSFLSSFS